MGRGRGTKQTVHFMFSHVHMFNIRFTILLFFCKQSEMPRRMCCDDVRKGRPRAAHIMQLYNMIFVLFIVLDLN